MNLSVVRTAPGENIFRMRLNELFAASGTRVSNRSVVKGMATHGCTISPPYLSQLRNGTRRCPSDEVVAALGKYFGVLPGYFFTLPRSLDSGTVHREDWRVISGLSDSGVRALLSSANGLSAHSMDLLAEMASKLRAADAMHIVPADSPGYLRLVEARTRQR